MARSGSPRRRRRRASRREAASGSDTASSNSASASARGRGDTEKKAPHSPTRRRHRRRHRRDRRGAAASPSLAAGERARAVRLVRHSPAREARAAATTAVKWEKAGREQRGSPRLQNPGGEGQKAISGPRLEIPTSPAAVTQLLATTSLANSEARMREYNSLAQAAFAALPQPPLRRALDGPRISAEAGAQLDEATKAALRTRGRKLRRRRAKAARREVASRAPSGSPTTSSRRSSSASSPSPSPRRRRRRQRRRRGKRSKSPAATMPGGERKRGRGASPTPDGVCSQARQGRRRRRRRRSRSAQECGRASHSAATAGHGGRRGGEMESSRREQRQANASAAPKGSTKDHWGSQGDELVSWLASHNRWGQPK